MARASSLEDWYLATIAGEPGVGRSLARGLLRVVSWGYALGVAVREAIYRAGLIRPLRVDARVLSVGNLTLGGTGKTPAVLHLAGQLRDAGERVAILIRGHGAQSVSGVKVVHDGARLLLDSEEAGDEAVLLAQRLGNVPVLAGKDRRLTARYAVEQLGARVLVLDDGFQYRKLAVDEQIVLVDATNPWGNGRLFPAGPLRDPLSALARAAQVWLTRTDQVDAGPLAARVRALAPQASVRQTVHAPARLWRLSDGAPLELSALRDLRVAALSGIGNPRAFERTLAGLGACVVTHHVFPDHHRFGPEELAGAATGDGEVVVTTEKDAVRLTHWPSGGRELWVLGVALAFTGPAAPD